MPVCQQQKRTVKKCAHMAQLIKYAGIFHCPPRFGAVAIRSLRTRRTPNVESVDQDDPSQIYSRNTVLTPTSFGSIRLDKLNVPTKHGEFEESSEKRLPQVDSLHPLEDLEGIMEQTKSSQVPLAKDQRDSQNNSNASKGNEFGSAAEQSKKKRRPARTICEDDIKMVRKATSEAPVANDQPKSAFEAVKAIREMFDTNESKNAISVKGMVDSLGFRLIRNEIEPPLDVMDKEQILKSLRRRILFNSPEVLILNKPCGMSMHGGGDVGSDSKYTLTAYLPNLAEYFKAEKLYTVHRLDKEVTGVLCLAKNRHVASVIELMFKAHQVKKEYLAITRGVIKDREGTIDLPIAVGHINGSERMVIVPRPPPGSKERVPKFPNIFEALTEYKIVSAHDSAGYWKLRPVTGYKHQIRVHLGFGLRCTILGDHKYSHVKNLNPQKLPGDMLNRLRVRQQKVREIPLHLHSRSLVIPGILQGGANVVVRAPPSKHFQKSLENLKLV
ncbi:RNA pseudouridylate synthase domain-containing protein 4-like [Tropilaelaps mercedesae]|uniref:Pseudouridylate synthase RPUSD4, mitochondrial n=1 Tax=Tropilaelaps mercedesae TaxID=418985 RepID=A0A1V9XME5_9ACAR|nr:RNA pseudouridylate synthase domain-containing protein 4-like [Tropilaelaps mercedesae]